MSVEEEILSDYRFPCKVCGADLRYDPNSGGLKCNHCGHEEHILAPPALWQIGELDLTSALNNLLDEQAYETTRTARCENCGASIEFDVHEHAKECAYCASPVVIDTGGNRHLKPRGVVPFVLDEPTAHKALAEWLGKRWFAPSGLAEYARKGRKMNGIYIPFWTYDAQTRTQYHGQRGDVYYVTVGSGKNRRQEARVRWSRRSGRVARFFDDVLILASRAMPKKYTDALAPWGLEALEPYNPEFLAGYRAEAYSVTLEEGWQEAQVIMKNVIVRDIKFDIGGDRQRIDDMKTDISEMRFKHILLPIYTLAYKFRGETYRCVINGQTGRVTGERPYSVWKIAIAVILALIAAGLIFYFGEQSGAISLGGY